MELFFKRSDIFDCLLAERVDYLRACSTETMELTLISGIQLGIIIEIEYTISDDGGVPRPSSPSRFKI